MWYFANIHKCNVIFRERMVFLIDGKCNVMLRRCVMLTVFSNTKIKRPSLWILKAWSYEVHCDIVTSYCTERFQERYRIIHCSCLIHLVEKELKNNKIKETNSHSIQSYWIRQFSEDGYSIASFTFSYRAPAYVVESEKCDKWFGAWMISGRPGQFNKIRLSTCPLK